MGELGKDSTARVCKGQDEYEGKVTAEHGSLQGVENGKSGTLNACPCTTDTWSMQSEQKCMHA